MRIGRTRQTPHGFALVAVLVVMGGALLVATSLLFVAQAEIAGSAVAADRAQAHALARSGVVAVIARLNEQRQEILDGRTPRIDEEFVIYETAGRIGVVRLLAVGPGGEVLVPEASKRDLQYADAGALAATGTIDEALARAIVDHRDQTLHRPYQSVGELLNVPGMSAETMYGPIDELGNAPDTPGDISDTLAKTGSSVRGLSDVVTVYGFEPALQQDGTLRINLNMPWSDELAERVTERFGSGASETLQGIMASGTTFDSDAKIFGVLNFFQMEPSDWPEIIDTFTSEDGELHYGRLDINTAPYEALLTLPGIEPEQAADIVRLRDDLSDEQRATVVWLAIQGIVEPQAYEQLGGLITTRSWTYRLRLAAGEVDADSPPGAMAGAIVYEVVLDLSSPRPRIAYLREISWLRTAAMIAANVDADGTDDIDDTDGADDTSGRPVLRRSGVPGATRGRRGCTARRDGDRRAGTRGWSRRRGRTAGRQENRPVDRRLTVRE
ncbi:MAG: hypothetical protein IH804_07125 [Planctomycetes bacterium]|nr:hypothetical protein [Planctomycetota bacterium]